MHVCWYPRALLEVEIDGGIYRHYGPTNVISMTLRKMRQNTSHMFEEVVPYGKHVVVSGEALAVVGAVDTPTPLTEPMMLGCISKSTMQLSFPAISNHSSVIFSKFSSLHLEGI